MEMRFKATSSVKAEIAILRISNTHTNEFVEILPTMGTRVHKLYLQRGNRVCSVLEEKDLSEKSLNLFPFHGAKLSPFSNRIEDGKYVFNDTVFKLEKNFIEEQNACHGFIYKNLF
ncbi:MAG TPA: aldose 1-epimerase, partial [Calditrichaeota bacterium]|nr:aldose 1-epimerase [Calditrichota bacterium]